MATKHEEGRTSIKIKNSTIRSIKKIGVMGETYDEVINKLIFLYNNGTIGKKGEDPKYIKKG